jgi:two-component system sensor histidine kinase/response regulator
MPGFAGSALIDALQSRGIALPARTIIVSAADAALLRAEVIYPGIAELAQKPLMPNVLRRICMAEGETGVVLAPENKLQHPGILSGMRILLVEDNEINQQVAREILSGWGAVVDVAAHGRAALSLLFSRTPDSYAVVLMDLEMPVMDGREAVRRLRADDRFKDLPIIAMTAHTLGLELQRALAQGIDGYIAKPFEPEELLALLRPFLHEDSPRQLTAPVTPPEVEELKDGSEPFVEALKAMEDIDSAALLRRFGGRMPFLAKALQRFADDARHFVGKLKAALLTGDRETAHRHAHSFKGLAGTFAMTALQGPVLALEKAITEGGRELAGEIAAVETRLGPLLEKLEQLPACLDEPRPAPDAGELAGVLSLLRQQLTEGDGEAEELWRSNKSRLGGLYSPLQLAAIERAINQWNVDEALAALAQPSLREETL